MVMASHQRIVVGVDGTPSSVSAARWAAATADALSSPLHIIAAIEEPTFYMAETALVIPAEVRHEQRRAAERNVNAVATIVLAHYPNLAVTTGVADESATDMLVGLSRTARLLVVGNSGAGLLVSTLFGSTARMTADQAACPVVIWRAGLGETSAPVLLGVDGSATSEAAIEHAFDFASMLGVPLIAAHTHRSHAEDEAEHGREGEVLLSESLAGWGEKYPDVQVEHVLRRGNPAHVLVELSKRSQLVVVGSHGRGVVARALLGSTSGNLTRHAHCPVMICRDR